MTGILVISDVHANKVALDAVLSDAESAGYDKAICLGDLVGYFCQPNECVRTIRERCDYVMMGNHDAAVAGLLPLDNFSKRAKDMIRWTKSRISRENREYLASLPISVNLDDRFLFVHGSPEDRDAYMLNFSHMSEQIEFMRREHPRVIAVFYGHTHLPAFFGEGGTEKTPIRKGHVLDENGLHFINPGSTCQLRRYDSSMNGKPLPQSGLGTASYGILDTESLRFSFHDVNYSVSKLEDETRRCMRTPSDAARWICYTVADVVGRTIR